uniref:Uncharacterized protein n=1 Tax=Trichogramma kaykai TaxID=54128 RepID=A0ABD2VYV6_9HYME
MKLDKDKINGVHQKSNCPRGKNLLNQRFFKSIFADNRLLFLGCNSIQLLKTHINLRFNNVKEILVHIDQTPGTLQRQKYEVSGVLKLERDNVTTTAAYSCGWYEFSNKTKQLIHLMLIRSNRPCELQSGPSKILKMNYVNFTAYLCNFKSRAHKIAESRTLILDVCTLVFSEFGLFDSFQKFRPYKDN